MFFVIKYDREEGACILFEEFTDDAYKQAQGRRLEVELAALDELDRVEVVMLEAESLATLKITHRRYFEGVNQMAERMSDPYSVPRAENPNPRGK